MGPLLRKAPRQRLESLPAMSGQLLLQEGADGWGKNKSRCPPLDVLCFAGGLCGSIQVGFGFAKISRSPTESTSTAPGPKRRASQGRANWTRSHGV